MIDTINFYKNEDYTITHRNIFLSIAEIIFLKKKDVIQFQYRSFKILVTDLKISLSGSASESVNGCNSHRLYHNDFCKWIDEMSDALKIDLREFKISRIDINFDLAVKYPPEIYRRIFVSVKRIGKFDDFKNTSYASAYNYTIKRYDKMKKSKRYNSYLDYTLRLEFSFKRKLGKLLYGEGSVYLSDIMNKKGYSLLYGLAIKTFKKINLKNTDDTLEYKSATTFKDIREQILKEWAIKKGGQTGVRKWVDRIKSYDKFNDRKGYERLFKNLTRNLNKKPMTHDFAQEVTDMFYSLVRYHL